MEEPNDDIEQLMQEAREEEEALSAEEESLTDEVAAEDKNGRHIFVGGIRSGVRFEILGSQPTRKSGKTWKCRTIFFPVREKSGNLRKVLQIRDKLRNLIGLREKYILFHVQTLT